MRTGRGGARGVGGRGMPAALRERDPAAEGGALNRELPCLILFLPADPACHHAPSGHEWNNVPLAL